MGFEEGAWGVDGHTFSFEVALSRPLPVGGYALLSTRHGRRYLGQVTDQRTMARPGPQVSVDRGVALGSAAALGDATVTVTMRLVSGDGLLLAEVADPFAPIDRHATFDIADIEEAPPDLVDDVIAWSLGGGTGLDTGAAAFKVLFGRLTTEQQALVLSLDPLRDPDGYAAFRMLRDATGRNATMAQFVAHAERSHDRRLTSLAERIRNLGAPTWHVWAAEGDTPVLDALPPDHRVIVADLGSVATAPERSVQSAAVLEWLWQHRHERIPRLVVIDEAHNVCPQTPASPLEALATEHVIRIAAEGRKYGLYLLLSTQQPQKIHANVLSQCDNLIVLRMNSAVDTDHLARVFGFVAAPLLRQASAFRLGEGLVASRIAAHPLRFQGARRWTREGGADVPATWAQPASHAPGTATDHTFVPQAPPTADHDSPR